MCNVDNFAIEEKKSGEKVPKHCFYTLDVDRAAEHFIDPFWSLEEIWQLRGRPGQVYTPWITKADI